MKYSSSFLFVLLVVSGNLFASDLDVIRSRIVEDYKTTAFYDLAQMYPKAGKRFLYADQKELAHVLCKAQSSDGSWSDIPYDDKDINAWDLMGHLARMHILAQHTDDPKIDQSLRSALRFWLKHDFKNENWWWNEIGVPLEIGPTLFMYWDRLGEEEKATGIKIMERPYRSGQYKRGGGANLLWITWCVLQYALLTDNPELVRETTTKFANEIKISRRGSLQPDYSFFQHGRLLYSHGYGESFLEKGATMGSCLAGTEFAFPQEKIEMLLRMQLDANQWMMRGSTVDYSTLGRQIVRPHYDVAPTMLPLAAEHLLQIGTDRDVELRAYLARLSDPVKTPLVGNRYFPYADYIAHHRASFFCSVRAVSNRVLNSEICNDQGESSYFLGYGNTTIMLHGNEYTDVFPLWDWTKIPGTTTPQDPGPKGKEVEVYGATPFSGGDSDGMNGVYGYDFSLDTLTAKKSWFFLDETVVCLGAGITDTSGSPIDTTLNQCWLKTPVLVDGEKINNGTHSYSDVKIISHDGVVYHFPQPQQVKLKNDKTRGNWNAIDKTRENSPVEGETFTLEISHGINPEDAQYAYILAFGDKEPTVRIISNTPKIQAVWDPEKKIGGAVFYEPGEIELAPGVKIKSKKPGFHFVSGN